MRIAFLNSCLEPERDGVGDYTRLLAGECMRQGHMCCTIALNDRYVLGPQAGAANDVKSLRLPMSLPWLERVAYARRWLEDFAPDWVSLQFVPYAFHPKGTIFGLTQHLLSLFLGWHVHIMFHETWIGELAEAPLRHRAIGRLQRYLIVQLVRRLRPILVHTSNSTYQAFLTRDGINAQVLPLFGNIPVATSDGGIWLRTELRKQGLEITAETRTEFYLCGLFGAVPADWVPDALFFALRAAAARQRWRVAMLSLGNLVSGEAQWQDLARRFAPDVTFYRLGTQPAAQVSQYLHSLDLGIATTDYKRIGKSGAVAAMIDHGLPVVVSQDQEQFPNIDIPKGEDNPLLYKLDRLPYALNAGLTRQKSHARLPEIAAQFVADLLRAADNAE